MNLTLDSVLERIRTAELVQFDGVELDGPNVKDRWAGETPLHIVAKWGDVEAARVLIDAGAVVDACGEDNFTPLHYVLHFAQYEVSPKHLELVRLLIACGADANRRCSFGSALDLARLTGSDELLKAVQAEL